MAVRYLSSYYGLSSTKISYLDTGVSRRKVARKHCDMPAIPPLFLFFHHLYFPLHLNITFSRIFPAFEHYFFSHVTPNHQRTFAYLDKVLLFTCQLAWLFDPRRSTLGKSHVSRLFCSIFITVSNSMPRV